MGISFASQRAPGTRGREISWRIRVYRRTAVLRTAGKIMMRRLIELLKSSRAFRPRIGSIKDREAVVRPRDWGGKTPGRDTWKLFRFGSRPACRIVELVGERAALLPASAFGPNE